MQYTGVPENVSSSESSSSSSSSSRNSSVDYGNSSGAGGGGGGNSAADTDIELGAVPSDSGRSNQSLVEGNYMALNFGLQVMTAVADSDSDGGEGSGLQDVCDLDEMYVHAAGALYTSSDIYGLPEGERGPSPAEEGDSGGECVICLTDMQEIFLLPCRCVR